MAYCFHADESVRTDVRRIGLEQIDLLLIDLRCEPDAVRIHDARRRCKMLRALLRLLRGALGPAVRRAENARWREVARSLGRVRDAEVRLETFRSLISRPTACPVVARRIAGDAEAARSTTLSRNLFKRLDREAQAGRAVWADISFCHHGWRMLAPGLRRSYRATRAALRVVTKAPSDDALHEWRKRVKTLWYHVRLLSRVRPKKLKPLADSLDRLGKILGEDHDLAMLTSYARAHDGDGLDVLDPLIADRRRKLQRKALRLAHPLLHCPPSAFVSRIEADWRKWRA